jgi:hypothetical protein
MWTRQADDTVIDEDGKVVYFGLERFVRDICLGDCCFVCGAQPGTVPFNDEHVIPKWLLRRYDLFKSKINLPNGTTPRYDRYTVPCCEACNTMTGRVIEEPMRQIIEGGFEAVSVYREKHGILKFYVWVGFIFLKNHLKDRKLRAHLDPRKGTAPIAEDLQYDWKGPHYLHTLVRCFATDAGIHTSALRAFVIIGVQPAPAGEAFDFGDLYAASLNRWRGMLIIAKRRRSSGRVSKSASTKNLDGLLTGMNFDAYRGVVRLHFISATNLSSDNRLRHFFATSGPAS